MPPPPPVPDRTETLAPRASSDVPPPMEALPADPAAPASPEVADDPERYQQIREHARGGLGRIVRAVDKRLGRTVAVKELLRRGGPSSVANEARFLREALITARLEHPGIVPVHEAGRWPSGDPYYVMKLVEGRTLKEQIAAKPNLRDRLGLLPHVIAVADAVGYAHSEGVIHRDLKPSNVIVGEFGETIVVDWGLARDRKRELAEPADAGNVVGTPAYMSPEQARGEPVDERVDVYAIGAVLYELLAGVPPHHDDTPQATLDRVIAGPPRPIAMVAPQIPSELATIVNKAMARCPDDRYANATVLAEDLRRFQTGKLVSAHSYSTWSLVRKKLSNHRGMVAVAVASTIALGGVGVESFRRVVAERNIARNERAGADQARAQAERRQDELVLLQAVTSLRKDPTATLAWLKTQEIDHSDRAHVLDVVDEAIALGVARHVFRPGDWVFDAAFTPDSRMVIAAVRDGIVRAYDLDTGVETQLGKAQSAPEVLAMSPDGSVAITGGTLGEVTLWPLHGGEPRILSHGGRIVSSIEFSADRTRVLVLRETGMPEIVPLDGSAATLLGPKTAYKTAVASSDWTRQVIATSPNQVAAVTGSQTRPLGQTSKMIARIVMSPHGETVLVHDGTTIWTVPFEGGPMKRVVDYDAKLNQAAWSPDQRTLAICGDHHHVVLVDLVTGISRQLRGHTDAIYSVQWSHDGTRLLSASDDGTARVWTVADATAQVLRGHDDDVYRARFSSDERQVATSSLDGSIRVWAIEQPGSKVLVEGEAIEGLTLEADRALVTTAGEVARWNLVSGHREPVFSWAADPNGLGKGLPSPDGERLLVPAADWSLEVRRRSKPTITLRGHRTVISHVEFSRDSKLLYTSSLDGTLRRWDLDTGESTILIDETVPVSGFAVAADGRVAAQVGDAAKMIMPDGTVSELGHGAPWCVAFAEFEQVRDRLLMRRCDNSVVMLDGGHLVELPTGGYYVSRLAVSPDGLRVAGAMGDRTVRLWDATTGQVVRVLRGHSDLVMDVAFSPDGTTLASASYDKTIRVWELASERHRVLRGHALSVNRVVWREDGHLVTASRDGTLRIWDVPSLALPSAGDLAGRLAAATTARIDIDRPTTGRPAPRGI
ncbi:MAG: WD-repeat protein [Deltaproteobacteria bacterium]|nr:WD-repeat protein [Deltaproteobacteria bacterium]